MFKRWFVVVDPAAKTYHMFKLDRDGDIESDPRIKNHVRSKYGIDWDKNRQYADQLARIRPASFGRPANPLRATPWAAYVRENRREPQVSRSWPAKPKRLRYAGSPSAFGRMQTECEANAYVDITTRDLLGYGVRLADAQSYAYYNDQFYGDFDSVDDFAGNLAIPQQPSAFGTMWYIDSQEPSAYWDDDIAVADQSVSFYNTDFNLFAWLITGGLVNLSPELTEVYNYTYADAGIGGSEYIYSASGVSGYYYLLGFSLGWDASDWCD
jgi:hypothetical protein